MNQDSNTLETLRLLQDHLIQGLQDGREPIRVGGFLALLHPHDPLIWLNQSVPVSEATPDDLRVLIDLYKSKGRQPFFEFAQELWPDVPLLLEREGLVQFHAMPVMVFERKQWCRVDSSAQKSNLEEIPELLRVAVEVYGAGGSDQVAVDRTIAAMNRGALLTSVAKTEGSIVSVGQAVGTPTVREVAGLATLSEHRRQGHCTAVIHSLLNQHFDAGGQLAWLTPGSDGARQVYEKVGFNTIATQVVYGPPELKSEHPDET